jgi:hypothetical protein
MSKCSDIQNQIGQYKNQIDAAFQEINRIKGLLASATTFEELQELKDRQSAATIEANRAGNALAGLLQAAQQAKCGSDLEAKINSELNYSRSVSRQGNTLGGDIFSKQNAIQNESTTKENNAGTGEPGTAGQGPGADDLEEVGVTGKRTPETVTNDPGVAGGDGLEEVSVTGKRTPETVTNDPGATGGDGLEEVSVTGKRATDPGATGNKNTVPGIKNAQSQAVLKDTTNFAAKKDWRVRLSLSPGANYLYKAQNPGILAPLQVTDGVLFPYTPSIQVAYNASYDGTSLTHTNYKFYQYTSSSIDTVQITCDFTAQDTYEANYLLAVIHFFRSVTKMFYGQDQNPKPGTPPPLCYLFGLGEYQFNAHPLAITNFTYSLPNNVDYIRASLDDSGLNEVATTAKRSNLPTKAPEKPNLLNALTSAVSQSRLVQGISKLGNVIGVDLVPGGGLANPDFANNKGFNSAVFPGTNEPTYVPTSIQISISCIPIVSRYDISNTFNLRDYATGELLRGVKRSGGGIW